MQGQFSTTPTDEAKALKPHEDWTNRGFIVYKQKHSPHIYFVFNLLAFAMEGLLGYCGLLVLVGTTGILVRVITCISKLEKLRRAVLDGAKVSQSEDEITRNFEIEWKWDGLRGRCGLHEFDKVYGLYVLFIGMALIIAGISVFWNIFVRGGPDRGSWIAIIFTVLLFPCAFIWIMYPYWSYFPDSRSDDPEGHKAIQPQKWPFGSKLSWSFIIVVWSLWLSLVSVILKYIGFIPKID